MKELLRGTVSLQRLLRLLDGVRTSLWFVPAATIAFFVGLAVALVVTDRRLEPGILGPVGWLFATDPDAAREILSTIAGSMITVAGVVFSITMVVLSLASSQYSPRVVRGFMRDRVSQGALGVFLGVFVYAIVVLGTIVDGTDSQPGFVPVLAVVAGVGAALVAIGYLALYIHHVARAIQAVHLVATAAEETLEAVEHLFPQALGDEPDRDEDVAGQLAFRPEHSVAATRDGYIQRVDLDMLIECACDCGAMLRMERRVGEFVMRGATLVTLQGWQPGDEDGLRHAVERAFVIARFQTVDQDVGFGIRQLVDIALKGLSPGINDETTAAITIDYLGAVLGRIGARFMPGMVRHRDGQPRVIASAPGFGELLALSFDQICRFGRGSPETLQRVVSAITAAAERTPGARRREQLATYLEDVADIAERGIEHAQHRAETARRARASAAAVRAGRA